MTFTLEGDRGNVNEQSALGQSLKRLTKFLLFDEHSSTQGEIERNWRE